MSCAITKQIRVTTTLSKIQGTLNEMKLPTTIGTHNALRIRDNFARYRTIATTIKTT